MNKLNLEIIRETIKKSTPYLRDEVEKNFIGQDFEAELSFFDLTKRANGKIDVYLTNESSQVVSCEIEEASFPKIKIISQGFRLKLKGKIKKVSEISVSINEAILSELLDEPTQTFFPEGSKDEIIQYLKKEASEALELKIYDPFIGVEILEILKSTPSNQTVKILGKDFSPEFLKKIEAFNIYFDREVLVKKSTKSHDRFWIIDEKVFSVGVSLRGGGIEKATLVSPLTEEQRQIVKENYDLWWTEASEFTSN